MDLPVGVARREDLETGMVAIRAACERIGRDATTIGVRAGLAMATRDDGTFDIDATLAPLAEFRASGVTVASFGLGRFLRRPDDVRPFLSELAAGFR